MLCFFWSLVKSNTVWTVLSFCGYSMKFLKSAGLFSYIKIAKWNIFITNINVKKKEKQNQKEKASILKLDYLYKTFFFFLLTDLSRQKRTNNKFYHLQITNLQIDRFIKMATKNMLYICLTHTQIDTFIMFPQK